MTRLELSRLHFPVTTLGPGRRIGVWFQGCSIQCPGCISVDTWRTGEGGASVEAVLDAMAPWLAAADGLTVTGGEPFDQPEALRLLLEGWRRLHGGDVLVFSGFEFETIAAWTRKWPNLIDAVVAGPFLRSEPQTLALRGSDNQTLHVLTERGSAFATYDRTATDADRKLDVMFDAVGGAWFAGIPARDDFRRLQRILQAEGHRVRLADRSGAAAS